VTWRRDRRSASREGKRTSAGLYRGVPVLRGGIERSRQIRVVAHRRAEVKPLNDPHPLGSRLAEKPRWLPRARPFRAGSCSRSARGVHC
jgi:hypothetical protein